MTDKAATGKEVTDRETAVRKTVGTGAAERVYFPLYVDIRDKDILFVGGGSIAARRVGVLQPFADRITVVAAEADPSIRQLSEEGAVKLITRAFVKEDLQGRDIVFAVTDDRELNAKIAALCGQEGILVNVSSDKELCDFYFPGIVRKGETVIGISASGKDHRRAREVRENIQALLEEMV